MCLAHKKGSLDSALMGVATNMYTILYIKGKKHMSAAEARAASSAT